MKIATEYPISCGALGVLYLPNEACYLSLASSSQNKMTHIPSIPKRMHISIPEESNINVWPNTYKSLLVFMMNERYH